MSGAPSGRQFEIAYGDTVATAVEVGGALRALRVGDRPLLDGYPVSEMCSGARGQSLLPWPNRVRDGRYSFAGQDRQLAITEPAKRCAIHGLVRWVNWSVAEHGTDRVTLTYRLPPQPGWAWPLELSIAYRIDDAGITVETRARNLAEGPAPFAAGAHPYLYAGTDRIDECTVTVRAASYLPTDEQQIPTGVAPVTGTPYDLRRPRRLGEVAIDHAYDDLDRDSDGIFRATLAGTWTTEAWQDAAYRYVEVFTGDSLPEPDRRRRGLGVEPMTAPPNALATGTDLDVLGPGQTWVGRWGVRLVG